MAEERPTFDFSNIETEEEEKPTFDFSAIEVANEREARNPAEKVIDVLQRLISVGAQGTGAMIDTAFAVNDFLGHPEAVTNLRPGQMAAGALELQPPDPNSLVEQGVFEMGAAALPAFGLIKAGSKAPKLLQNLGEFAQKNKTKFLAGEAFIAGGVGATRATFQPETLMGAFLLEMGTSFSLSAPMSAFSMMLPSVRQLRGTDKAARILQEGVEDVAGAVRRLETPSPGLTAPAVVEDTFLLNLERSFSRTETGSQRYQQARVEANSAARLELQEISGGEPGAARDFIEARVEKITRAIDDDIDIAISEASETIAQFPGGSTATQSETLVNSLDGALKNSRIIEADNWAKTNFNVQVETAPLIALRAKFDGVGVTQRTAGTKLPAKYTKLLTPSKKPPKPGAQRTSFGAHETAQEIQTLRSLLLADIRLEASSPSPDRTLISMYHELADTAMDMLVGGESIARSFGADDAALYMQALETTRKLNARFYTGDIGDVMKFGPGGARKVNEVTALEKVLKPGTIGGANARQLVDAVGPEEARNISARFMSTTFGELASNADGSINLPAARRFLSNKGYAEILDDLPEVRTEIEAAITAAEKSGATIKIGTARKRSVMQRSRAALMLEKDVAKVPASIRAQKDPAAVARELASNLSSDPDAAMGFKRIFLDDLEKMSTVTGTDTLRHTSYAAYLKNNKSILVGAGFTPDELARLDTVADHLRRMELSSRSFGTNLGKPEDLNALQMLLGRVGGASTMRFAGFNTIQATGAGANVGRKIMAGINDSGAGQILEAAIFDPDLMQTLLLRPTAENTDFLIDRLRGHFANIGIDIDKDENNVNGVQF